MRVVELLSSYLDTSHLSQLRYTVDTVCKQLDLSKARLRIYRNLYESYKYGWWPSKYEVHSRLFEAN